MVTIINSVISIYGSQKFTASVIVVCIKSFNALTFGSNTTFNKSVPKFGCSYRSPFLVNNKLLTLVEA